MQIELPDLDLTDLSGGLNEAPITKVEPNQMSVLENWYPYGRWLRRRNGVQYESLEPASEMLHSLYNYVGVEENRPGELVYAPEYLIGGGTEALHVYRAPGWSTPTQAPAIPYDFAWTFKQYNNALYACRLGAGLRVGRPPFDSFDTAGVQAPVLNEAILTQQDGGELDEGYYEYVFTFRQNQTNTESARSPTQRILTDADDKWINIENIPQPVGYDANEIRIYRSLRVDPDATVDPDLPFGEYWYVDTVPVGVSTYEDKRAQIDLGSLLGNDTFPPPGDAYLFEMWQERAWLSNGEYLIWSEVQKPEQYNPDNVTPIEPGEGQRVTCLRAWQDRLVVAKRNRIFVISHVGPNSWNRDTLSDTHGIPSLNGAQTHEGTLFFFGGDNFYRSDGGPPYAISTTHIRTTLDNIPESGYLSVHTAIYPLHSWFLASVPQKDGSRVILVHNYKEGTWAKFTHWDNVTWIGLLLNSRKFSPYCTTNDGHAYRYDKGLLDRPGQIADEPLVDEPIKCRLRTGGITTKANPRLWLRRFKIMCDTVGASVKATLYSDESSTSAKTRTVPLHQGEVGGRGIARRWKLFSLNALLEGYTHQLEIEYEGRDPINIEGLGLSFTEREDYRQRAG